MFRDLPQYLNQQETSMPWCPSIPDHWHMSRNKALLEPKHEKVGLRSSDYDLLSLTKAGVIYRDIDGGKGKMPAAFDDYQAIEDGDLIMCLFDVDETPRTVGRARQRGMITGAYNRFVVEDEVLAEYLNLFYKSVDDVKGLRPLYRGLRKTVPIDSFLSSQVPLPPVEEQTAIVKYLAHANARIDNAIAAKRRLITLLEEQRAAVRDKLIEEGAWPRKRLKTLLLRVDQGVSPQAESQVPGPGEWGVVKSGCVNNGRFRADQVKRLPDGFVVPTALCIAEGDLLVSRANGSADLVGSAARVVGLVHQSILSDKTFRLVLRPDIDTDFLAISMNSRSYRQQVLAAISGAEGLANNLPLSALRRMEFSVPPIDIQRNIVKREHVESRAIERTSNRVSTEILLLEEFRTRLVADVVTGQVDVRAVAETLPDPIMPDVSLDEDGTSLEDLLGHEDD
ncbi:hypothetical protein [Schaalia sp. JY-X169]|uniref:hypothetical protein n=1 Tax=Schaalia sp. JY-X169 TaxID=2758572 RepID=UPI0015F490FD|nr:hypothetical protein [Schaalia sp. JY-X169]